MAISQLYPTVRPDKLYDFSKTGMLPPDIQLSRASTGTYVDVTGNIAVAPPGTPRFDYNVVTNEIEGLLIESSRNNNIWPSEPNTATPRNVTGHPGNAYAVYDGAVESAVRNTIGGLEVTINSVLDNNGYSGGNSANWGGIAGGGNHLASEIASVSFFINPLTWDGTIWLGRLPWDGNTTFVPRTFPLFNDGMYTGLQRYIRQVFSDGTYWLHNIPWTSIPSNISAQQFLCIFTTTPGDEDKKFWAGGFQRELGTVSTSYIKTTNSAVTRAADILTRVPLSNSTQCSIIFDIKSEQNNSDVLSLNDSTTTNEIRFNFSPFSGGGTFIESSNNFLNIAGGNRLYRSIIAASIEAGGSVNAISDNSTLLVSDSNISSTNLPFLNLGSNVIQNILFNGYIRKVYYYPSILSSVELSALSNRGETTLPGNINQPTLTLQIFIQEDNTSWGLRSTGPVNYNVDWGDGQIEVAQTSNSKLHTYVSQGIYKVVVRINSGVWRPNFGSFSADAEKISAILATGAGWNFGTNLQSGFNNCRNLSFISEDIKTDGCTSFQNTWAQCNNLKSFPFVNSSTVSNFFDAWFACSQLTSFPLIDTSSANTFARAWRQCSSLRSFPLLNSSNVTSFSYSWEQCAFTSFPPLDLSSAKGVLGVNLQQGFFAAWSNCGFLTNFPANMFDSLVNCNDFSNAFQNCALSVQSIENILVSIDTCGETNGNLNIAGGNNARKINWTSEANLAYDSLIAKGWSISFRA
jgi:hypothetical protein